MLDAYERSSGHNTPNTFWQPNQIGPLKSICRQAYFESQNINPSSGTFQDQSSNSDMLNNPFDGSGRLATQFAVDMLPALPCGEQEIQTSFGHSGEENNSERRSASFSFSTLEAFDTEYARNLHYWVPQRVETWYPVNQPFFDEMNEQVYEVISANINEQANNSEDHEIYTNTNLEIDTASTTKQSHAEYQVSSQERFNTEVESYPIIRQSGKIHLYNLSSAIQADRCKHIDLKFSKTSSFEDITQIPWSAYEETDCRRVVRITRFQKGTTIELKFLVVVLKIAFDTPNAIQDPKFVEVSCLKCTHEGDQSEHLITSVEVIRIVELLIGSEAKSQQLRREERGRIRSNLVPLWHKGFTNTEGMELSDSCSKFLDRLRNYQVRKPYNISKLMRLLSWENLIFALRRAIEFYRIVLPDDTEDS